MEVYKEFSHVPTIWLGLGSNILFPDGELNAHIIKTQKALNKLYIDDGIYVEAGVPLAKLAKFCVKHGYQDAAFLVSIPGSLGGALLTNAEAYGCEIWSFVKSVTILTEKGIEERSPKDFLISYRQTQLPKGFIAFLSARLQFNIGSQDIGHQVMKDTLRTRNRTQPIGTFNCGSVFRNPKIRSAGLLLDGLGLKGYSIGDALISPVHANFIENAGNAKSADVMKLIQFMRGAVWNAHRIQLNLEVKVYG